MNFQEIAAAFALQGEVICCKEFGSGHINNTFKVSTDADKHYVLSISINTFSKIPES